MNAQSPAQARLITKAQDLGHSPEIIEGCVTVEVADWSGCVVAFSIFSNYREATQAWSTEYRIFNEGLGESFETPRSPKSFWADWSFYTN